MDATAGSRERVDVTAYGLLSLPVLLWGGSFWATEIAIRDAPPLMVAALRAALVLVLLAALPLLPARLPRGRMLAWALGTGLLMVTVFFATFTVGTDLAGTANASVLTNTWPLLVLVLSWWTLGERVSRVALVGLLAGFAGVVVMVAPQLGGTGDTGDLVVGIVVSLIASLAWAVGTLIVKWLASGDDELEPLGFTVAQFVAGAPVLLVIAFVAEGAASTDWSSDDLWGSVAFLAFGSSCLGTVGFFAALRRLPATRSSSVQFLAPVVAVLIEIGRGHTPETVVLLGMALAIVSVAVVVVGDALLTAFRLRTAAARA